MVPNQFHFDQFTLDPRDRRLRRAGKPLELSSRYFDALALLLRERGQLVTKERFLNEVWHGVPVTDEALTQCIRSLRRCLGDDAARPRLIETVPKHGYRFIGAVETGDDRPAAIGAASSTDRWRRVPALVTAAMAGGGVAGILGGLFYGFGASHQSGDPGFGATSLLFVLLALNMLVGLAGGAGVGLGLAAAEMAPSDRLHWSLLGGGAGGLAVGGAAKLVGLDAFALLFGESPGNMTGAPEGAAIGAAVGFATWTARRYARTLAQGIALGGLVSGSAGAIIALSGGTLLGGSLDLLLRRFPDARFQLDPIGRLFGEAGFGPVSHAVTAGFEAMLFGACVVGAMLLCPAPDRPANRVSPPSG